METPEVCNGDGDDQIPLPGFRFHPTDEELVSFYLRRKVDKRPISLELIKQIDIYKHNPWDLPYASSNVGDKEWYFYCKRGRKYKNSIRPNRVTGSGFWKATGIDKPVYSNGGEGNDCIGLKKTLVYYRGSAGKGTKTDWMMHEFRLPPPNPTNNVQTKQHQPKSKNFAEEAEIWTLCRIFKRNVSSRRYGTSSNWNNNNKLQTATTKNIEKNTKNICSNVDIHDHELVGADQKSSGEISHINFRCESMIIQNEKKPPVLLLPNIYPNNINIYNHNHNHNHNEWNNNNNQYSSSSISMAPSPVSSSGIISPPIASSSFPTNQQQQLDVTDFFTNSNWDELRSMVDMF